MNKQLTRGFAIVALTGALVGTAGVALAQQAGSTTLGISQTEVKELINGWSVKKQILGATVYNEAQEKVGKVDDIIVAPDRSVSYAIVGAGGFVGLGKHEVAIPVQQFRQSAGKLVLPGATKDAIKALPEFEYSKAAKS
ncbi:PRC-barrel domain-containing protein [Derxia lacustris]|uniref:PRC-barrel domain-containing protein n=1 Tax=Derxia lacustris TaxID=764842 RepID=UPI000A16F977|nr:PRC-barrel domain-containing protein [Derxia lacustris]